LFCTDTTNQGLWIRNFASPYLVCPVTNQMKGYPFEVPAPPDCGVTGAFLADHVKSLDWKARQAERIGRIPPSTLNEVLARLAALLGY
jgi:mRNA interferase MazF